jgi:hypothetical protein
MENPACKDNYEEAKKKAKEFYGTIGRVWCPVLGDYVLFTRDGFQHLVRRKAIQRPKSEQKRRFSLLTYAEAIVRNPVAKIMYKEKSTEYA